MNTDLTINQQALSIIEAQFKEVGITSQCPYRVLKDGLTAERVTYDKYGDEHREPDYKERRENATIILTMMGHLKAKAEEVKVTTVNVQVREGDIERLEKIAKELDDLHKRLGSQAWQRGEVVDVEVG